MKKLFGFNAHLEKDENAGGGGGPAKNPEVVYDPDGKPIAVEDLFRMRAESTRRYEEASRREERLQGILDRLTQNQGGGGSAKEDPPARVVDLSDLDELEKDALAQAGTRIDQGVKGALSEAEKRIEDKVDQKLEEGLHRNSVHQANLKTADGYFTDAKVPPRIQAEILKTVRALPKTEDNGHVDERGYFVYNRDAFERADFAVRGKDLLAAAEARGRQEGVRQFANGAGAGGLGQGDGGGIDLKSMSLGDRIETLDRMNDRQRLVAFDSMTDEEIVSLVEGGFELQMQELTRGHTPQIRR